MFLPGLEEIVGRALAEDIGTGDITTQLTVPPEVEARAVMVAKAEGIVAGLPIVAEVYRQLDPRVTVENAAEDGEPIAPGQTICRIHGPARSLLTGERVALNFVQRLSGIATKTDRFVQLATGTQARIVDTRKTTPGLRILEKYAVRIGGGYNHRFGLYDAILIKDNHIQASGGITQAVEAAQSLASHTMSITVECDTLDQVDEAVNAGADVILLDNMSLDELWQAIARIDGRAIVEVSGGVNEETVAGIAQTGVDIISVGALTHSAVALDIGLDLLLLE